MVKRWSYRSRSLSLSLIIIFSVSSHSKIYHIHYLFQILISLGRFQWKHFYINFIFRVVSGLHILHTTSPYFTVNAWRRKESLGSTEDCHEIGRGKRLRDHARYQREWRTYSGWIVLCIADTHSHLDIFGVGNNYLYIHKNHTECWCFVAILSAWSFASNWHVNTMREMAHVKINITEQKWQKKKRTRNLSKRRNENVMEENL